jgi:hypothetical protein
MWVELMDCRSLAESEASTSPLSPGCEQFFIASVTDTPKPFSCPGCGTVYLIGHQFGATLRRSEAGRPEPTWTSSTAGSHNLARISVARELARAWKESEVVFSSRSSGLQKKLIPPSCFSKTFRRSALADFEMWSEHLPIFGMTVGGLVFLPQKLEPRTYEKDGSCLPTPSASSYGTNRGGAAGRTGKERPSLETMARKGLWPTPTVRDSRAVCSGDLNRKSPILGAVAKFWSTPKASDGSHGGPNMSCTRGKPALPGQVGGQLNPTWVEWLMGYPSEWTELEDWAMLWFRPKRKRRSKDWWD